MPNSLNGIAKYQLASIAMYQCSLPVENKCED